MYKEKAADLLDNLIGMVEDSNGADYDTALKMGIEALTAQPQRTGQWEPEFNGMFTGGAYWFKCSECNRIVPDVRNGGWNFCPQCGADMKGE